MAKLYSPAESQKLDIVTTLIDKVSELAQDIFDQTTTLIGKGLDAGNVNGAQGLLYTMIHTDLLHGGAYRWDQSVAALPYYSPKIAGGLSYSADTSLYFGTLAGPYTFTIPEGYAGAGTTITLPAGASSVQAEVLANGFVPHILPQVLSHTAYIQVMERCGQLLNTILLQNIGTGLKTYTSIAGDVKSLATGTKLQRLIAPTSTAAQDADSAIS